MKNFFRLLIEMLLSGLLQLCFQKESLMILTGHWLLWL